MLKLPFRYGGGRQGDGQTAVEHGGEGGRALHPQAGGGSGGLVSGGLGWGSDFFGPPIVAVEIRSLKVKSLGSSPWFQSGGLVSRAIHFASCPGMTQGH